MTSHNSIWRNYLVIVLFLTTSGKVFGCSCSGIGPLSFGEYESTPYIFIGQVVDRELHYDEEEQDVTGVTMKFKPYKIYKLKNEEEEYISIYSRTFLSSSCGRAQPKGQWMFLFTYGYLGGCDRYNRIDIDSGSAEEVHRQVEEYISNSRWDFLLQQFADRIATERFEAVEGKGSLINGRKEGQWNKYVKRIKKEADEPDEWRVASKRFYKNDRLDSLFISADPRNHNSFGRSIKYKYDHKQREEIYFNHGRPYIINGRVYDGKGRVYRTRVFTHSDEWIGEEQYTEKGFRNLVQKKVNGYWESRAYFWNEGDIKEVKFRDSRNRHWDPYFFNGYLSSCTLKDTSGKGLEYHQYTKSGSLISKTLYEGESRTHYSYYSDIGALHYIERATQNPEMECYIEKYRRNGDLLLSGHRSKWGDFYVETYINSIGEKVVSNGSGHLIEWYNDSTKSLEVDITNGILHGRFREWREDGKLYREKYHVYSETHQCSWQLSDTEFGYSILRFGKPYGTHTSWWQGGLLYSRNTYDTLNLVRYDTSYNRAGIVTYVGEDTMDFEPTSGKIKISLEGLPDSVIFRRFVDAEIWKEGTKIKGGSTWAADEIRFYNIQRGKYEIRILLEDGRQFTIPDIYPILGKSIYLGYDIKGRKKTEFVGSKSWY